MSRYTIPLRAVPSQTLTVQLAGQAVRIDLHTKRTGMFVDVYVAGVAIVQGVLCLDRVRLVRRGMIGDFFWVDTQGTTPPVFTGLQGRYVLVYDDSL